jgi:hypothetical protein
MREPDNVRLDRTVFGQGSLCSVFEFWSGLSRAGQCSTGGFYFVDDMERTWSCSTRLFSLHPSHPS